MDYQFLAILSEVSMIHINPVEHEILCRSPSTAVGPG
jgi:hypothetical protein